MLRLPVGVKLLYFTFQLNIDLQIIVPDSINDPGPLGIIGRAAVNIISTRMTWNVDNIPTGNSTKPTLYTVAYSYS